MHPHSANMNWTNMLLCIIVLCYVINSNLPQIQHVSLHLWHPDTDITGCLPGLI